jgi:hypothetical protein
MERPGGRLVRELANGVGDPAPHGLAVVIVLRGQLVGARSAFLKGLVAVPLEHEVGGAPDTLPTGRRLPTSFTAPRNKTA